MFNQAMSVRRFWLVMLNRLLPVGGIYGNRHLHFTSISANRRSMQNFPVGLLGFLKYRFDILLHFSSDACGHGNEPDQVTRLPQKVLDVRDVGKISASAFGRHGIFACFLDQGAGADDALGGGDEFGHNSSRMFLTIIQRGFQKLGLLMTDSKLKLEYPVS